ncbi:acyl-CoA oxidase [Synchytrium microbalum]|uniref:Acyl-coenzyme A oxidase n=1 Tax=Synchytrium microbalum TaxID=1806994 RepID=A0A507CB46_9FUNG|nr:acyl-CoA oxidase [Synchytrium microbalum]TPX35226.1 acyl-CoA oxidase [Synchytrium microbalum]
MSTQVAEAVSQQPKATVEDTTFIIEPRVPSSWIERGLKPGGPSGADSLKAERAKASFNVEELTNLIYGPGVVAREQHILSILLKDPLFKHDKRDRIFKGRTEKFKTGLAKTMRLMQLQKIHGWSNEEFWSAYGLNDEASYILLAHTMFINTIISSASPEQQKHYLPLLNGQKLIGVYAQTELGHGSNVQRLETVATFIEGGGWDIHSPTLTASKWWIGGLGRVATHVVLMAQLVIKGKNYGVHPFLIQIRDLNNHMPLKGITIGDIGPKFGFATMDNGYMLFDHYTVPLDALLMRAVRVDADGTYTPAGDKKTSYLAMTAMRASIARGSGRSIARAATITTRYSAIRRQFANPDLSRRAGDALATSSNTETAVLDYPQQQNRISIAIAKAFALHFAGVDLQMETDRLIQALISNDNKTAESIMPELHASSSALKALSSTEAAAVGEDMRQACGGHGFSTFSGFTDFLQAGVQSITVEGENRMISMQTTRYLMKTLADVKLSPSLANRSATSSYLGMSLDKNLDSYTCPATSPSDLLQPKLFLAAFQNRMAHMVKDFADDIAGSSVQDRQVESHRLAMAHAQYTVLQAFHTRVVEAIHQGKVSLATGKVLRDLVALYALSTIETEVEFATTGYFSREQRKWLRPLVRELVLAVRKEAVALVDSWAFSDYYLGSALGRKDGKVYETMLNWTTYEPLNASNPVDGYEEYIKPILNGEFAKL